jgi:hypothetical protein
VVQEEYYLPFIQTTLDRCAELENSNTKSTAREKYRKCNLNDKVGSGGGWFQLNFQRGTLMHIFASAGYNRLADLWVSAGGSATETDLVGTMPAVVAARNGHFNFPGASEAAQAAGVSSTPFGFTQRRELSPSAAAAAVAEQQQRGSGGWSDLEADLSELELPAVR